MKKTIIALAIMAFGLSAHAANCGNDKPVGNADCTPGGGGTPGNGSGNASSASSSASHAIAGAAAGAVSGSSSVAAGGSAASRAMGGNASATGGAGGIGLGGSVGNVSTGPSTSTATGGSLQSEINVSVSTPAPAANTTTRVINEGTATIKTAPAVVNSNIYPTAPCMGSSSVGASWLGGGLSGGTSWESDHCNIRETARLLDALGMKDDAIAVLCQSKFAAEAPACKARAKP